MSATRPGGGMSKRLPQVHADPTSIGAKWAAQHGMAEYKREYTNGWKASSTGHDSAKFESGAYSDAWEDGYMDAAAGRAKWHYLYCPGQHTYHPEAQACSDAGQSETCGYCHEH